MSNSQEIFIKACEKVFDCWTALNLAVDNSWGGDDSKSKKDLLVKNIIEYCLKSKDIYSDEIEDILVLQLEEYFNVALEDSSEKEIATILVRLHKSCSVDDFTYANELMENLKRCSGPCVSGYDSCSDEDDTTPEKNNSRGPRTSTDEEGWTTIL